MVKGSMKLPIRKCFLTYLRSLNFPTNIQDALLQKYVHLGSLLRLIQLSQLVFGILIEHRLSNSSCCYLFARL